MNGNELVGILFLAIILERLWELVFSKPLFDNIAFLKGYKWTQIYFTVGLGVFFAFVYGLDIVSSLTGLPQGNVGITLTGIALGGGSQLVHGLIKSQSTPAAG